MEVKGLPKIAPNSSQNPHLQHKRGWNSDVKSQLDHSGIKEDNILENKNNIENTIAYKFKDKLWSDKDLEGKMKLRYYKEVINSPLANQNYLFVLTSAKKKTIIGKIKINSRELQSETSCWFIPKISWGEINCLLCHTKRVKYKNIFLFDYLALAHICSLFQNISHTTNFISLLSQQNYNNHRNKILKKFN